MDIEYDPETMTLHRCSDCGRLEPVADGFSNTPYCTRCAGRLDPAPDADAYAARVGYEPSA